MERFNGSLKYEHLYRLEIPDLIALHEAVQDYRELYNTIRPHEALGFATPLARYLAADNLPESSEPSHVSEPECVLSN